MAQTAETRGCERSLLAGVTRDIGSVVSKLKSDGTKRRGAAGVERFVTTFIGSRHRAQAADAVCPTAPRPTGRPGHFRLP